MKRRNKHLNNNNNNKHTLPPILRADVSIRRKRDSIKLRNAAYKRGLYTGKYLRNVVTRTKYASEVLLDKFRLRAPMTELERQAAWALLWQLVNTRATRHYGQFQYVCPKENKEWYSVPAKGIDDPDNPIRRGYDRHIERIMLLLEWLTININRSVGWCITSWKCRFAAFEEIRYWRYYLGIGVDLAEAIQSSEVRWSIYFRRILREHGIDECDPRAYETVYRDWLSKRKRQPPRKHSVDTFNRIWARHIIRLQSSGVKAALPPTLQQQQQQQQQHEHEHEQDG